MGDYAKLGSAVSSLPRCSDRSHGTDLCVMLLLLEWHEQWTAMVMDLCVMLLLLEWHEQWTAMRCWIPVSCCSIGVARTVDRNDVDTLAEKTMIQAKLPVVRRTLKRMPSLEHMITAHGYDEIAIQVIPCPMVGPSTKPSPNADLSVKARLTVSSIANSHSTQPLPTREPIYHRLLKATVLLI